MDRKEVEKIGRLSRLNLTPNEIDFYTNHLSMILSHFQDLASIPTENVEPLVTPTSPTAHRSKDEVVRITTTDEILKNAPERSGNLFKVPPVVGGD